MSGPSSTARVPLIRVRDLSKIYPDGTAALKNVSFDVYEGEFLVIIGLSGSGKTTLLRCLNRLIEPTHGEIWFGDTNVTSMPARALRGLRQQIGMIFQHFNLVPRLSARTNVLTGSLGRRGLWASLFGQPSVAELESANRALALVGLAEKADLRASQLSGGQQQRVAIARALQQNPRLLLADEPVASLDPATAHLIMDYLRVVNRDLGITVMCNLHYLSLVREYGTRVLALRAGELVFEGSPDAIDESWFKKIYGEAAREIHVR